MTHRLVRSVIAMTLIVPVIAIAQRPDSMSRGTGFVARATTPPARHERAARPAPKWAPSFDYIDAQTLNAGTEWLDRNRNTLGGNTLHTSPDLQTTYLLVRRRVASQPEVHARWDDIVIVRSGTGVIVMGDSLVGSKYRAPGERAGGTMNRNFQLVVRAGEIVRIPAAVPHMFIVSGAEPLEYLLIKQRRQSLPIRWASGQ
jgi:mannose-6-phosphate isomerase-like protein (cupin superfamily)